MVVWPASSPRVLILSRQVIERGIAVAGIGIDIDKEIGKCFRHLVYSCSLTAFTVLLSATLYKIKIEDRVSGMYIAVRYTYIQEAKSGPVPGDNLATAAQGDT
jgi:hypothetical protein